MAGQGPGSGRARIQVTGDPETARKVGRIISNALQASGWPVTDETPLPPSKPALRALPGGRQ